MEATFRDLFKVDIWAYGCIIYCILNPDVPYPFLNYIMGGWSMDYIHQRGFPLKMSPLHFNELVASLPMLCTLMPACLVDEPWGRPSAHRIAATFGISVAIVLLMNR